MYIYIYIYIYYIHTYIPTMSAIYINAIHILINQDKNSSKFCSKKRPLVKIPPKIHAKVCEGNRAVLYSCSL